MENEYFKDLDYTLLNKKVAYDGKRVKVEELKYLNERQGKEVSREHVIAGDAAIILPITENNEVIMIKEARTTIGKIILGLPAGMLEKGETAEQGALRELEEETGYRAEYIKKLRVVYPSVGYSTEKTTIFLAKDLVKTSMKLDDEEDIEVVKVPIHRVKEMLKNNELITSGETVALFHYFMYEE